MLPPCPLLWHSRLPSSTPWFRCALDYPRHTDFASSHVLNQFSRSDALPFSVCRFFSHVDHFPLVSARTLCCSSAWILHLSRASAWTWKAACKVDLDRALELLAWTCACAWYAALVRQQFAVAHGASSKSRPSSSSGCHFEGCGGHGSSWMICIDSPQTGLMSHTLYDSKAQYVAVGC